MCISMELLSSSLRWIAEGVSTQHRFFSILSKAVSNHNSPFWAGSTFMCAGKCCTKLGLPQMLFMFKVRGKWGGIRLLRVSENKDNLYSAWMKSILKMLLGDESQNTPPAGSLALGCPGSFPALRRHACVAVFRGHPHFGSSERED